MFLFFLGVVHEDLKTFLESNVPTGKKKSKVQLGISDSKIGASIQESCDIQCESGPAILEITRGIRCHFHKLIQGKSIIVSIHFFSEVQKTGSK